MHDSIPKSGTWKASLVTDCIDGCTKVHGGREKVSLKFRKYMLQFSYIISITTVNKKNDCISITIKNYKSNEVRHIAPPYK